MKTKSILFLMVVFLPLSTLLMKADEPKPITAHIPLSSQQNVSKENRDITLSSIECSYFSDVEIIQTNISDYLGEITIEVLNTTTGEYFYDSFDSAFTQQHILNITGSSGFYTITYSTESGETYLGTLELF